MAFLILRLLNLTVFRSLLLGAFVRRQVIAQLVTAKRFSSTLSLERSLRFLPDRIHVHDRLRSRMPGRISDLRRVRSFTAIHMGSANYFAWHDAVETLAPDDSRVATTLRRDGTADERIAIVFPEGRPAALEIDPSAEVAPA